jgi:hypothetical protein
LLLEFLSNGQRRDDMPAGPATRQNDTHAVTINHTVEQAARDAILAEFACASAFRRSRRIPITGSANAVQGQPHE